MDVTFMAGSGGFMVADYGSFKRIHDGTNGYTHFVRALLRLHFEFFFFT